MSRPRLVHPAWVISLFVSCLLVCLVFFPLASIEASSTAQSVRSSDFDLPSALRQIQHQVRPEGAGFGLQNPENQLKLEFHDGGMTAEHPDGRIDRKSTRLNASHLGISYAVFCLKKKNVFGLRERKGLAFIGLRETCCGAAVA